MTPDRKRRNTRWQKIKIPLLSKIGEFNHSFVDVGTLVGLAPKTVSGAFHDKTTPMDDVMDRLVKHYGIQEDSIV